MENIRYGRIVRDTLSVLALRTLQDSQAEPSISRVALKVRTERAMVANPRRNVERPVDCDMCFFPQEQAPRY